MDQVTFPAARARTDRDTRIPAVRTTRRTSFYLVMGLVAVGLALVGFVPGLIGDPAARRGVPTPLVVLHGIVFSLWLGLYILQTTLVRQGRRSVHRRLGWAAVPLGIAIVAVGYATTIASGRRGFALWWHPDVTPDPLTEMVHPLGDLLTFSLLVSAAMLLRSRAEIHKRLMLLATVGSMMAAPVAHLVAYFSVLRAFPPAILLPLALLYFSSAIRDRIVIGRVHPVSLWGGLMLFGVAFIRAAVIGPSDAWHRFAAWLIS